MNTRTLLSLALAAGLATSLAACDGSSDKATTSPSTSASSTPPPSTTPAPTTPSVTQSVPVPAARTKAELTKALLALPELPSGFSIDPDAEGPDDEGSSDTQLSSKDPRCKDLVLLFNAITSPGSKATAYQSFTGGQNGPYFDEELDAMASPAAATALLTRTKAAIKSCKKATLTVTDVGSSTVTVNEIAVPKRGTNPVGGRFTATTGKMAGFEIFFAFTGVGDVVIAMSFDGGDQVEGALDAAVTKATKVLGAPKTGT